jgi:spermidine synthase
LKFSNLVILLSLILVLLIGWLGPQFIYQIRPYTFYISGFAIGGIMLLTISSNILSHQKSISIQWNLGALLASIIAGYFIPWIILQYIVISISILIILSLFFLQGLKLRKGIPPIITLLLCFLTYWEFSKPTNFFEEQTSYEDKVVFSAETQYHQVVITQWHNDYWCFIDNLKNISSIDEYLFYEPMAHSVFKITDNLKDVLIIGGENGCLIREVLKHKVNKIEVISYDTLLRNLGKELSCFTGMNKESYSHEKVQIRHENLIAFASNANVKYDAIFIDLPDPRSIETNQYYTLEFYQMVKKMLNEEGLMIAQSGSPYFATQAFNCIGHTLRKSGFNTLPIHNQILTLGEWGWYICSTKLDQDMMKEQLINQEFSEVQTKWFNQEAAKLVSAFGKTYSDTSNVGINTLENPLVYQYYLKGNWDLN